MRQSQRVEPAVPRKRGQNCLEGRRAKEPSHRGPNPRRQADERNAACFRGAWSHRMLLVLHSHAGQRSRLETGTLDAGTVLVSAASQEGPRAQLLHQEPKPTPSRSPVESMDTEPIRKSRPLRRSCDHGQSWHAQGHAGKERVRSPPTLLDSFHSDALIVAQPSRIVVWPPRATAAQAGCPPQRAISRESDS